MKKLLIILTFILIPQIVSAGVLSPLRPITQPSISNGLIGWWTFDGTDTKSGTIKNGANSAENGAIEANATTSVYATGKIGQGLSFNGSTQDVILPNSSTYNFSSSNNFTVSAWVKINNNTAYQPIFSTQDGAGNGGFGAYISSSGKVFMLVTNGTASTFSGNTTVTPNVWHHVAFVFTGPTSVTVYLDGKSDGSGTFSVSFTGVSTNKYIGYNPNLGVHLNGKIDEVRVYNRALSATEIRQLSISSFFVPQSVNPDPLKKGLTGYWSFDGNTILNGVLKDLSGNNRNANLISIATSTFYAPSKIGQGGNFDGVNDAADTNVAISNFMSASTGSMAVWVYPFAVGAGSCTSGNASAFMVDKTQGFMWIEMDATNFCLGGGDPTGRNVTTPIVLNKWTHLVWVHSNGAIQAWKNGVFIGATALGNLGAVSGTLRMGAGYNSVNFPRAIIDDARVYNTALSTSTIQNLYINSFLNPNK